MGYYTSRIYNSAWHNVLASSSSHNSSSNSSFNNHEILYYILLYRRGISTRKLVDFMSHTRNELLVSIDGNWLTKPGTMLDACDQLSITAWWVTGTTDKAKRATTRSKTLTSKDHSHVHIVHTNMELSRVISIFPARTGFWRRLAPGLSKWWQARLMRETWEKTKC